MFWLFQALWLVPVSLFYTNRLLCNQFKLLGPAGFFLLIYFTYNAIFVGQRLGLCWIMLEERFPELKQGVSFWSVWKQIQYFALIAVPGSVHGHCRKSSRPCWSAHCVCVCCIHPLWCLLCGHCPYGIISSEYILLPGCSFYYLCVDDDYYRLYGPRMLAGNT